MQTLALLDEVEESTITKSSTRNKKSPSTIAHKPVMHTTEKLDTLFEDFALPLQPVREFSAVICYNSNPSGVQSMLDYDYLCGRDKPSVQAIVNPTTSERYEKYFFGSREVLIPLLRSLKQACTLAPSAQVMANFASSRSVLKSTLEAIAMKQFHTITILAEGVPERHAQIIRANAKVASVTVIGPASIGCIYPTYFKTGTIGGSVENIIDSCMLKKGRAGLVSRSGGMFNELAYILGRYGGGVGYGVAIGGDRFPGSGLADHVLAFESVPEVEYTVVLGEVGGKEEYELISLVQEGKITKPVIAYCIGTSAEEQDQTVQFGHAGASANDTSEKASVKNAAMKKAGISVPATYVDLIPLIKSISKAKGPIVSDTEKDIMRASYKTLVAKRKTTHFVTTISDDRGEEPTYAGVPLSKLALPHTNTSIVDVLTLLWFKRRYPQWATDFIETVIKTVADHGPSVSGAIVAKITARAGKDAVSSLIAGLSTIGPRFGGAIDGSARQFHEAMVKGMNAEEFVEEYKSRGELLLGIGHKVKSIHNPDTRVAALYLLVKKTFPITDQVEFARKVELVTTSKKPTLILNVDGLIANAMIDLWNGLEYSPQDIDEMIETGVLNGFFIIARSIGLLGHIFDEKRQKSGLYRHPSDDILFLDK